MADVGDDLIDYEDDEETSPLNDTLGQSNGDATAALENKASEIKKGSYVGIHATGFKDFLLKPELLRAIVDCGFEHPSEGTILSSLPIGAMRCGGFKGASNDKCGGDGYVECQCDV